jgi:transcriptional regulator with PAS, ATPase and Fis domain
VNVAGAPAGVFESQLFGYVAGAYSGSGRGSPGVIAAHEGGAVFLDEIGELPLELQPKLLRLLENREMLPVGATRPVPADVLLITATNRSLEEMVERGAFRRDLLARLEAGRIELPPLRERRENIVAIMGALAARRGVALDPRAAEVEAVERLLLHAWPANVRELATTLDRTAAIEPLPRLRLATVERVLGAQPTSARKGQLTPDSVAQALAASSGNESEAARRLGVTRGKLRRFLAGRR